MALRSDDTALRIHGIVEEDLETRYLRDPAPKSTLRVVARPGNNVPLTRNFDKTRGIVNGGTGTVCRSLDGTDVFTVKLHGTGNMVLMYPMEEKGAIFLPCCYGYATTIRRSQGASLAQGCLWFKQKRHAARDIDK